MLYLVIAYLMIGIAVTLYLKREIGVLGSLLSIVFWPIVLIGRAFSKFL